jgi:hypothetical protein
MNWTKLAEDRIEEAISNGEFDHLPGKGQPIDLAEYFALPAAERAGAMVLKNANVVPPEVQLLKEIAGLETAISELEAASLTDVRNGKNANDREMERRESHATHYSYSSHGAEKRSKRLHDLRAQLQEKRVAFNLSMERRRRRDPRAID